MLVTILFCSCSDSEDRRAMSDLQGDYLQSLVQTFEVQTGNGSVELETRAGCTLKINTDQFILNDAEVEGVVAIDLIEIFDRGTMAISGKHTESDSGLLVSGGQFYVSATSKGENLEMRYGYRMTVPVGLAGVDPTGMELFYGERVQNSDQNWSLANGTSDWEGLWLLDDENYGIGVRPFGWFNCDRFANFPGPQKPMEVQVPTGLQASEYNVYLAIKGEPSALGTIRENSTYPLGLDVHLIFLTPDYSTETGLLYATRSIQLADDTIVTFDKEELKSATVDELAIIINALP